MSFKGLNWGWLSIERTRTNAPWGSKKTSKSATDRGKSVGNRLGRGARDGGPIRLATEEANRQEMKRVQRTRGSIVGGLVPPIGAEHQSGRSQAPGNSSDEGGETHDEWDMPARVREKQTIRTRPWEVSDAQWMRVEPLIPERVSHAKGGRPPEDDRKMFTAIVYVLRTGIQWNALPRERGASTTVYDRFRLWEKQGFFTQLWQSGLQEYDELVGLDWEWQSMDGVMTKAPLGGEATGPNPTDRGKRGTKRSERESMGMDYLSPLLWMGQMFMTTG